MENAPLGRKLVRVPWSAHLDVVCDTAKHGEAGHGELSLKVLCSQGTRQAVIWRSRAACFVWFIDRTHPRAGARAPRLRVRRAQPLWRRPE